MREHDFHYALENTKVILPPQKRLETFGTTVLNYHLITEEKYFHIGNNNIKIYHYNSNIELLLDGHRENYYL